MKAKSFLPLRTRLAPAVLLLLAVSLLGSTAPPTARRELLRLEQRWLDASASRDVAALDDILAADFVDTGVHGRVRDKAQILADRTPPPFDSQRLEDLRVRIWGDAAVVTGRNVIVGRGGWTARVRFTDAFVRRDGRWRAVAAQETLAAAGPVAGGP